MPDDTQQLIDRLQREKRTWKQLCIGFMIGYGITIVIILACMHVAFKPGASPVIETLVQQAREQWPRGGSPQLTVMAGR